MAGAAQCLVYPSALYVWALVLPGTQKRQLGEGQGLARRAQALDAEYLGSNPTLLPLAVWPGPAPLCGFFVPQLL